MGQIGEFAFIVAKAGQDLDAINSTLFPTIGIAAAITAFFTPYMIRLSYKIDPNQRFNFLKRRSSR
jgi:Kef-type K+ transport system membrane component KefB